jgi:cytochrome c oxidase cbb3-type subunit III
MSAPRDEDRLLDHQYDDIQEYDNPLPTWWSLILWVTIVWAVLYWLNVIPGVGTGKGRQANYEAEMAAAQEKYGSPEQQATAAVDVAAMEKALADPAQVALGKETFETTCAACHEKDGGGNIGPNLTDDAWIHGNTHKNILTTVTNGVPDKGMPTWSAVLKPEQLAQVSAYVVTLHGKTPAKAKAPQGEVLGAPVAEPAAAADTTAK